MRRLTAKDRMVRLLAVLPHVAGRGFVPVDEVAARFSYPRAELLADLTEVVQFVGIAPFTPDTMIEVTLDGERVRIDYADWFSRPMRLGSEQAVALLAAGRALLALDRSGEQAGPLLRALAKLATALGDATGSSLEIELGPAPEATLALLRDAVDHRRVVRVDYYSYGRDERHVREIEPYRFFADEGNWYVAAYCRLARDERVFRVDRIRQADLLEERFDPRAGLGEPAPFAAPDDAPRVTLELEPEGRWVAEQYPHEHLEELSGGRVRLTLAIAATRWLERLLLRLGDRCRIVEPPPGPTTDARADAARRILARYQAADDRPSS